MPECRNLEEFVYGPDGADERNLLTAIKQAKEEAAQQQVAVVRIRCAIQAYGTGSMLTTWNHTYPADAPAEALIGPLLERLYSSPGEGWSGRIRLSFEEGGNTANKLGNYSRVLRPGIGYGGEGEEGEEGQGLTRTYAGSMRAHFEDAVRPALEMMLRAFDRNVAMQNSAANLVAAVVPPPPQPANTEQAGVLGNLLQTAVGVAQANSDAERAGAAAHGFVQTAAAPVLNYGGHRGQPPSPVSYPSRPALPPPHKMHPGSYDDRPLLEDRSLRRKASNGAEVQYTERRTLTADEVERWARAHPEEARKLAMKAISEGYS